MIEEAAVVATAANPATTTTIPEAGVAHKTGIVSKRTGTFGLDTTVPTAAAAVNEIAETAIAVIVLTAAAGMDMGAALVGAIAVVRVVVTTIAAVRSLEALAEIGVPTVGTEYSRPRDVVEVAAATAAIVDEQAVIPHKETLPAGNHRSRCLRGEIATAGTLLQQLQDQKGRLLPRAADRPRWTELLQGARAIQLVAHCNESVWIDLRLPIAGEARRKERWRRRVGETGPSLLPRSFDALTAG